MLGKQVSGFDFRKLIRYFGVGVFMLTLAGIMVDVGWAANESDDSYYKEHPLFHPFPREDKKIQSIDRFGPVGIGIELRQPAFRMRIKNVEKGSPAAATGKLKKGQWIESVNGRVLKDIDPRRILGQIITEAEATDGRVVFRLKDKDSEDAPVQEVTVQIPALGAYSDKWPLECEKSDKIVRDFADYLARNGGNFAGPSIRGMGLLFMLSTGEEKDLKIARKWVKKLVAKYERTENISSYPWYAGYGGPGLCEYYLRTGDKSILPVIAKIADNMKRNMYNSAWGGRGGCPFSYMGGGHMNAAGVHVVTFLLLAKECGVEVDEYTLQESLKHFYRFAGRGNTPYGDGLPEGGFVDNGKVGGLAFAMAAATSLNPEGENSVYAKARDISAVKGFYSTSWMLHGHTGGGIGEIWRSASMGLMYDKKPTKYREFMDNRMWFYELSRRYNGSFGIIGGGRYDKPSSWGIGLALTYTMPRKTLQLTGAPDTQYSHEYKLSDRPWGTAADDVFYSLEAGEYKPGKRQEVDAEKLETDASWPILRRLRDPETSDDVFLMYCHHPDEGVRDMAAGRLGGRTHLVPELLNDKDPRARRAGVQAAARLPADKLTPEMVDRIIAMVEDPDESWWVVEQALVCLEKADPERLAPHVDRLAHWLKHEDWWLRKSALHGLKKIAADKRFYTRILPIIGDMVANNTRAVALGPLGGVVKELQSADPEVQEFAVDVFGKAYAEFPTELQAPGGCDMQPAVDYLLNRIARNLAALPGGFDKLYVVSKERFPTQTLPHKDLYLDADPERFGPELREAFKPIILNELIPQFIARNRNTLLNEAEWKKPKRMNARAVGKMDGSAWRHGLVDLYKKAGIDRYNWQPWGPAPDDITWQYHSFDPPEKQLKSGWRYRDVTLPEGMENWFKPEFNAKKAGWKSGRAPFAYNHGKLAPIGGCSFTKDNRCGCGEEPHTLWENEVLLMRTTLELPPPDPRYRYRLLVGGMSHVFGGDGFAVYIDGKQAIETKQGVGKRSGAQPVGFFIHREIADAFKDGKINLAVKTFRDEKAHIAVWLEKMLMPPLGETELTQSAAAYPMISTSYFTEKKEADKFQWNGIFKPNPDVLGSWKVIDRVETIEDFNPDKKMNARRVPYRSLTLKEKGRTHDRLWIWSGNMLMDLDKNAAWKMKVKTIAGVDYLFVEAGGYSWRTKAGWKPDWLVLKRE